MEQHLKKRKKKNEHEFQLQANYKALGFNIHSWFVPWTFALLFEFSLQMKSDSSNLSAGQFLFAQI